MKKTSTKTRNKGTVTYKSIGEKFNVSEAIVKKYVILIRDKKLLPISINTYYLLTFIESENKVFNILIQIINYGHFPFNNTILIKLIN